MSKLPFTETIAEGASDSELAFRLGTLMDDALNLARCYFSCATARMMSDFVIIPTGFQKNRKHLSQKKTKKLSKRQKQLPRNVEIDTDADRV